METIVTTIATLAFTAIVTAWAVIPERKLAAKAVESGEELRAIPSLEKQSEPTI